MGFSWEGEAGLGESLFRLGGVLASDHSWFGTCSQMVDGSLANFIFSGCVISESLV